MAANDNQPPQAWTCAKCGAALPAEAGTGELLTCGYCGTPFKLPTAATRCGGVTISSSSVTIGGDLVGRNKIIMAAPNTIEPAQTPWDELAALKGEGLSIDADELQVNGDVVGGDLVKAAPKLGWWEKVKHLFSN